VNFKGYVIQLLVLNCELILAKIPYFLVLANKKGDLSPCTLTLWYETANISRNIQYVAIMIYFIKMPMFLSLFNQHYPHQSN